MKYFILVSDNKIINSGLYYKVEDVMSKYDNIDESKTYLNKTINGNNEVLYLFTKQTD